jgi:hypothetical protein
LGKGFQLAVDDSANQLSITQIGRKIWDTIPGKDFLSASGGADVVTAANGNFKIEEVDEGKCAGLQITNVTQGRWQGSDVNRTAVVHGQLTDCGTSTVPFSLSFGYLLNYPTALPSMRK